MRSVDAHEQLVKEWDRNEPIRRPNIVETGVFGDESWSLEISNPIVEKNLEATSTGMLLGAMHNDWKR